MRLRIYIKNKLQLFMLRHKCKGSLHRSIVIRDAKYVDLGDGAAIGENSKLLCWSRYEHDGKFQELNPKISIGKNFRATSDLTIQCAGRIEIGDDVLVARNVSIFDYNHGTDPRTENYIDNELDVHTVEIGDGVWIGNNVIILPGTKIGKKSIIGAGSVVKNYVEPYCIIAGNPAKVVKKYDDVSGQWVKLA